MTEEVDLILGMMLSNCCPKTHLRNQTVGGENGSCGKTVVLGDCWLAPFPSRMPTHARRFLLLFVLPSLLPSELCCFLAAHACFCLVLISPPLLLLRLQVQIDRTGRPLVRRRHKHGLVQTGHARHNIAPTLPPALGLNMEVLY